MKINRCFPSCSNCLSHLLIPECSYKSYLPCWPHLSWKFFSPSMAASHVTSSTLCSRLCLTLASSRDSRPGFIPIFLALRIWSPQGSSFPRLLLGLPATSSKIQWSAKLSAKPLLWEDPFAPPHPVLTKLRALNPRTFPAGAFQPNWCLLIVLMLLLWFLVSSSIYQSWRFGITFGYFFFSVVLISFQH